MRRYLAFTKSADELSGMIATVGVHAARVEAALAKPVYLPQYLLGLGNSDRGSHIHRDT